MARTITVEVEAPKNLKAGEIFSIEVELPKPERKQRGQLAGIALEDMTDEQIKRELINANSVLYKAKQRGASEETIAANQARVDAAKAEKAKRAAANQPEKVEEAAANKPEKAKRAAANKPEKVKEVAEVPTDSETATEI